MKTARLFILTGIVLLTTACSKSPDAPTLIAEFEYQFNKEPISRPLSGDELDFSAEIVSVSVVTSNDLEYPYAVQIQFNMLMTGMTPQGGELIYYIDEDYNLSSRVEGDGDELLFQGPIRDALSRALENMRSGQLEHNQSASDSNPSSHEDINDIPDAF